MNPSESYYTSARNVQILIYLLKQHKIKKIVASPGTQNMDFVASVMRDDFFQVFSAADERSAAYIACGMAVEAREPVVITCTGATASRNYLSALTEAYYRHVPIVAVTATQLSSWIGHNIPQVIDRDAMQNDVCKCSVRARYINTPDDEWDCTVQINKALLAIHHHGTGPVHINLERGNGTDFSVKQLPAARMIRRFAIGDDLPAFPTGRVAIFMGAHRPWTEQEMVAIDAFCQAHDAVVFTDQTGNYKGKYFVPATLVASQDRYDSPIFETDLLIQMGDVSGDYALQGAAGRFTHHVWRVDPDGKIKDNYHKLECVFEMDELAFLQAYAIHNSDDVKHGDDFLDECQQELAMVREQVPELPFSNIWIAQQLAPRIPAHAALHFGILNSLRSWNFFQTDPSVTTFCNVGGFGIDGGVSTLLGASLASPDKLCFGVFGDLAFFYDMNALGNRHLGRNVRIILVNNATGVEFKLYIHPASRLEEEVNGVIAATGHYGNKSPQLVQHYAQDLGFTYLRATNKQELLDIADTFLDPQLSDRPMLLEVFTSPDDDNKALLTLNSLVLSPENRRKQAIKKILGEKTIATARKILGK